MTIHEWNDLLRQAENRRIRAARRPWCWMQGNRATGPFLTLEDCLRDARHHAAVGDTVAVGYQIGSGRRVERDAREWVSYRFDTTNALVPDLPDNRAMRRELLPTAQRS